MVARCIGGGGSSTEFVVTVDDLEGSLESTHDGITQVEPDSGEGRALLPRDIAECQRRARLTRTRDNILQAVEATITNWEQTHLDSGAQVSTLRSMGYRQPSHTHILSLSTHNPLSSKPYAAISIGLCERNHQTVRTQSSTSCVAFERTSQKPMYLPDR